MIARVLADASYVEIANQKARLKPELHARLYYYAKKGFIVSSVSGIAETGEPTILAADVANTELGCCVCDHVLQFTSRSPANLRDTKATDWGVYRVSGAKSIRSFEESSWMIQADTMNAAIVIASRPRLSLHNEISVSGVANLHHENIGAAVRRTLKAAMVLREQGVI